MNLILAWDRRGMLVVEAVVVLAVFGVIFGVAVKALRSQSQKFEHGADRLEVLQGFRYAITKLETDLRSAGANVPPEQPFFVYASPDAIAFNADYATNDPQDPFAVYLDIGAPTRAVTAMRTDRAVTIPGSAFTYPSHDFTSAAETIMYFFRPDSTTALADDYALFRQVNDGVPEVVARHLFAHPDGKGFFEVFRERAEGAGVEAVPSSTLPLAHTAPVHRTPADSGRGALIDQVRGVGLNLAAGTGDDADGYRRTTSRLFRMPNAGLSGHRVCGAAPQTPGDFRSTVGEGAGAPVTLAWAPAADEAAGDRDVVRYVLYRRTPADTAWGDPFQSIPSGQPAYRFVDRNVVPGRSYEYAVAAQDCTPSMSTLATHGAVRAP